MLYNEGTIFKAKGRLPQAETVLREAVQIDKDRLPYDDKRSLDARLLLGQVLLAEHRPAEASPLFTEVLKVASAGGSALISERNLAGKALQGLESAVHSAISDRHSSQPTKFYQP